MSRILDIVAQALSILLYPLFIPTYGVALFCYAFSMHVLPLPWIWSLIAVIGTFFFTCLLPITAIMILIRRGKVHDLRKGCPGRTGNDRLPALRRDPGHRV